MKLTKLLKAAAALVVVATALAGCKFEGTKSDFKGDEYNRFAAKTNANNPAPEAVTGATVSIPSTVTFTAEKDQPITVTVTSRAALDEKSFDAAFNVYTLTDAANNYTPVVKGSTLPKTLRRVAVTYNNDSTVTTEIYYYVDATGVTKDTLAFVADATKLKEKTGKLIMNGNGNEKCGEESDSVIAYVDIYAADGSALATLTGNYREDFAPTFYVGAPTPTSNAAENTVTYRISVDGSLYGKSVQDSTGTYIYPADLKGTLDAMYKLRTYAIGDKAWTTTALDWNYNATGHYYEAKTSALAYGTKYCFEVTPNNTVEWAEAKDYYGHTPRISWLKNKKSYTADSVWRVATTEPAYICQDPDNRESVSTVEWGSTYYDVATADSFASAQDNILTKSVYSKNKVLISFTNGAKDNDLRFDAYEGFAIVDDKYNIVKTKAPVVYEQDEKGVYAIVLETADSAIDLTTSSFTYWVGEKTTLKGNKKHSVQVKFGCPAVELTNTVVGYCAFN